MSQPVTKSIEVFFSYSHKDEELRDEVADHLSMLKRKGAIKAWHDRAISAGSEWANEIDQQMEAAEIILLLISKNFLASDYCWDIELQRAMERHEAGEARVIPIILKPCDWTGAPFGKLQALPKNAKPVTQWEDHDAAFLNIAQGIRKAVTELAAYHGDQQDSDQQVSVAPQVSAQASTPEQPAVSLWIQGWERHTYQGQPTIELDWKDHFCKSPWHFPEASVLEQDLLPQFEQLHDAWAIAYPNKLIELRSTLPLSLMLALGQQFPRVGRWRFQVDQSSVLWKSDAEPSSMKLIVRERIGEGRKNVLIALGMINQRPTLNGAKRLMASAPSGFFESFIYAEPEADAGALITNADAVALARQAKQLMQNCDALNIHLVIASPAAFCLFLGQQLNALGEVQTYEWHTDQRYVPSVRLRT